MRYLFDLRSTPEDTTQKMLNALEPGTLVKIHRHPLCSSTIIVLRGSVKQNIYDNKGILIQSKILKPNSFELPIYEIPQNIWHNLECLEMNTIIFECKNGKYIPETDTVFFDKK